MSTVRMCGPHRGLRAAVGAVGASGGGIGLGCTTVPDKWAERKRPPG